MVIYYIKFKAIKLKHQMKIIINPKMARRRTKKVAIVDKYGIK